MPTCGFFAPMLFPKISKDHVNRAAAMRRRMERQAARRAKKQLHAARKRLTNAVLTQNA